MKSGCEQCGVPLPADGIAYVCSNESTFCSVCFSNMHSICSRCGGELVRRPRRAVQMKAEEKTNTHISGSFRTSTLWALSFGVWTFVAVAYPITIYPLYLSPPGSLTFLSFFGLHSH